MAENETGEKRAPDASEARLTSLAAAVGAIKTRGPAPVHLWHPAYCGEIDMRIAADGTWFYAGTPIQRPAMIALFAGILRKDPERYVLVTPAECVGITVEDVPFSAVAMREQGGTLRFITNLGDEVEAGADHPLRFTTEPGGGVKPYVHVRGDLWARLTRSLAIDLLDRASQRDAQIGHRVGHELLPDRSGGNRLNATGPQPSRDLFAAEAVFARVRRRIAPDLGLDALDRAVTPVSGDHLLNRWQVTPDFLSTTRVAAVLVGLVDRPGGLYVLLTQRTAGLRDHSGQIAFPGGKMDPDDVSPAATALREAREEVGLPVATAEVLGYLDPYLTRTGFRIIPVVARLTPPFDLVINPAEVVEAFEVPFAHLMSEANHQLKERTWQAQTWQFYAMVYGERTVWGITAGILRILYEKLYL